MCYHMCVIIYVKKITIYVLSYVCTHIWDENNHICVIIFV